MSEAANQNAPEIQSSATETQVETAPQTTQTTESAPQAASATPAQGAAVVPPAGAPAPAWQPNFKFKSYDKEYEIEEMYRGLVKDAESEKKVKSLFEKAYAIDTMKPKYQKAQEEVAKLRGSVEKEYQPLARAVDELSALYAQGAPSGELEAFFKKLQIPDDVIFKYAMRRLDYNQLTPDQRAAYDRNVQAQVSSYQLQQQNQMLMEQVAEAKVQARTGDMNTALAKPEVREVQDIVDSRLGAGTFQREVINAGILAWKTEGKDITAEEAVASVLSRIRPIIQGSGGQQAPGAGTLGAPTQQVQNPAAGRPPVIPSVKGQGTSPVKQMPKSIADLRKIAASMGG